MEAIEAVSSCTRLAVLDCTPGVRHCFFDPFLSAPIFLEFCQRTSARPDEMAPRMVDNVSAPSVFISTAYV
jgi:hypothetical protein